MLGRPGLMRSFLSSPLEVCSQHLARMLGKTCLSKRILISPPNVLPQNPASALTPSTSSGYGLWREDFYGVEEALVRKRQARGWEVEESLEDIDRAYLRLGVDDQCQEEREMINLLLRWNGGMDRQTIFPGKLPWDRRGVSSRDMKAILHFGAEQED